jgi:hypothetical protein
MSELEVQGQEDLQEAIQVLAGRMLRGEREKVGKQEVGGTGKAG